MRRSTPPARQTPRSALASLALMLPLAAVTAAPPTQARAQNSAQSPAQPQTTYSDPANLTGESPRPLTGRELPVDSGAPGLQQALRRLSTRASLMLIVAHPDDEDGGMLTYYSRGLGARVAVLTLNRGEGGQNAATGDFEDALGLLRTQELLSADRYSGVTQMFGTEVDFGFSKTKSEAFGKWTHERVLYDAVRAVRIFRPLVIASVFVGGVTDGHGQHQVAGEIAQEVFRAAADPKVFPELAREGILPWQPLRVFARVPMQAITPQGLFDYATGQFVPAAFTNYVTGQTSSTPPTADIVVHEGRTDPLLTPAAANSGDLPRSLAAAPALSYVQFARIGLGLQRSQIGPGVRTAPSGAFDVAYHLYGSARGAELPSNPDTFFSGLDTSVEGIATLAPHTDSRLLTVLRMDLGLVTRFVETARRAADSNLSSVAATLLADALELVDRRIAFFSRLKPGLMPDLDREAVLHELRLKRTQLNDALLLALGVHLDAIATGPATDPITEGRLHHAAIPAAELTLTLTRDPDSSASPVTDPVNVESACQGRRGFGCPYGPLAVNEPLSAGGTLNRKDIPLLGDVALRASEPRESRPYFHRASIEQPFYDLDQPAFRLSPATPAEFIAGVHLSFRGVTLTLERVVHDGPQPVTVVPDINLELSSTALVLPQTQPSATVNATVTPPLPLIPGMATLQARPPAPWTATLLPSLTSNRATQIPVQIAAPALGPDNPARTPVTLSLSVATPQETVRQGFRPIGYGDLPRTNLYTPAQIRVVPVDLQLPATERRRIGYLPGTGDAVPEALASLGITPTILSVADLNALTLSHFDTVILGVRTYNAHPELHGAPTQALFDYARKGGNVVVQYQTAEFTGADAPYPLSLGTNEKVVDETAPVALLDPGRPNDPGNPANGALLGMHYALLSDPNIITPADFNGWVEERGHGFLGSWDPHYTVLTETHDPGDPTEHIQPQAPQRGGLVTVPLGSGRWTYVAFALYRQLPEAVPGAFRLFANLITPP